MKFHITNFARAVSSSKPRNVYRLYVTTKRFVWRDINEIYFDFDPADIERLEAAIKLLDRLISSADSYTYKYDYQFYFLQNKLSYKNDPVIGHIHDTIVSYEVIFYNEHSTEYNVEIDKD